MSSYFDSKREGLPRKAIEDLQLRRLKSLLALVSEKNPFYRRRLRERGVAPEQIRSLADMAVLPYTCKADFQVDQAANPPYGSNLTYPLDRYVRYHQTTGTTGRPLRWLDTKESWSWRGRCAAMSLAAAGVTSRDTIFFPFAFGPHVAYWGIFEGAWKVGALAVAGGGWDTAQRISFIMDSKIDVVACTPTYALRMAEEAKNRGVDLRKSGVRVTFHGGEPGALVPATRKKLMEEWGARPFDYPGLTEVGAYGLHCRNQDGAVHVNEAEFVCEVIDPQTVRSITGSGTGELVLTNLGRVGSPAIRFRTGDMVAVREDRCGCGRSFRLLEGGVIGRVDDMITVRGMNVFPSQVAAIAERHLKVGQEYRIVAYTERGMTCLKVLLECAGSETFGDLMECMRRELRDCLEIRVELEAVAPGTFERSDYKSSRFLDRRNRSGPVDPA